MKKLLNIMFQVGMVIILVTGCTDELPAPAGGDAIQVLPDGVDTSGDVEGDSMLDAEVMIDSEIIEADSVMDAEVVETDADMADAGTDGDIDSGDAADIPDMEVFMCEDPLTADCDEDMVCEADLTSMESCGECGVSCVTDIEECLDTDGAYTCQCVLPYFGNGQCDVGPAPGGNSEDWRSAPGDCMMPSQECGDGVCDRPVEDATSCIEDCTPVDGDDICEGPEVPAGTDLDADGQPDQYATSDCTRTSACSAAADCSNGSFNRGNCPDHCPVAPSCGDGVCNGTEAPETCFVDCPPDEADGVCSGVETCQSDDCPFDCAPDQTTVCVAP